MYKVDTEESDDERNARDHQQSGLEELFLQALAAAGHRCDETRPGKYLNSIHEKDVSFTLAESALATRPALAGAQVQFFLKYLLPYLTLQHLLYHPIYLLLLLELCFL